MKNAHLQNLIKDHLKQFQAPVSSCNEDMRALFLYLFEEIMVNKKGHLQCKLRFNLDDK